MNKELSTYEDVLAVMCSLIESETRFKADYKLFEGINSKDWYRVILKHAKAPELKVQFIVDENILTRVLLMDNAIHQRDIFIRDYVIHNMLPKIIKELIYK